jgi:hypothetical protein
MSASMSAQRMWSCDRYSTNRGPINLGSVTLPDAVSFRPWRRGLRQKGPEMRRVFRWLIRVLLGVSVLVVILVLTKDALLKRYLESLLRRETGCVMSATRFELGLFRPTLHVENLRVSNPPELGGGPFLNILELRAEYDPAAASRRELHFTSAVLNIAEMDLVYGTDKKSMLERIVERATEKRTKTNINFTGIDTLTLTLGRVYERKLKGGPVTEINVGITNRVLTNVSSEADLAVLVLETALRQLMHGALTPRPGRHTSPAEQPRQTP